MTSFPTVNNKGNVIGKHLLLQLNPLYGMVPSIEANQRNLEVGNKLIKAALLMSVP